MESDIFSMQKEKSHKLLKVILKIFLPVCTIDQNYACPHFYSLKFSFLIGYCYE